MSLFGNSGGQGRSGIKLLPVQLVGIYRVYYYFSNRETVPVTGRTQVVDITRDQEAALGLQCYGQIPRQENVVTTGRNAETIKSIGGRISAITESSGFKWEYNPTNSQRPAPMFTPPRAVLRNHALGEARSRCAVE